MIDTASGGYWTVVLPSFLGGKAAFLLPFVCFLRYWEVGIRVFTQKPSWGLSVVLSLLKLTIYVEGRSSLWPSSVQRVGTCLP